MCDLQQWQYPCAVHHRSNMVKSIFEQVKKLILLNEKKVMTNSKVQKDLGYNAIDWSPPLKPITFSFPQ